MLTNKVRLLLIGDVYMLCLLPRFEEVAVEPILAYMGVEG